MLIPRVRSLSFHQGSRTLLTFSLGLLLGSIAFAASSPGELEPGMTAPPFSGARIDGGTLGLEALRGHVILLNFWAVNCPPCRIEMPELEKLHRRYEHRGLRLIGITQMNPERDQVARFIQEIGVTYPILLDPEVRIGDLYGIVAHPTSVLIDANGIVRFVNTGYLKGEEKDIERAVRAALDAGGKPLHPQARKP